MKSVACAYALIFAMSAYGVAADERRDEMSLKIQEFNRTINSALSTCQFKVAWDSIRDFGLIDDEKFGINVASKCGPLLVKAIEMIGPQLVIAQTFRNLAFARKKVSQDGVASFKFYEEFDYSGEIKATK